VEQVIVKELRATINYDAQELQGYVFYTKDRHFHRLHGLYKIIFDVKYRETLAKDGAGEYLAKG
jgi:hypothetical protein